MCISILAGVTLLQQFPIPKNYFVFADFLDGRFFDNMLFERRFFS